MDVREIMQKALLDWASTSYKLDVAPGMILAALKEAGYAVIRVEPKAWDDVLAAAQEQEGE